jgi:hypothetical protein
LPRSSPPLWNPKVHYRLHKRPPLVHALSQMEPIDIFTICLFRSVLILISHPYLGLPCRHIYLGVSTEILQEFFISLACYMPRPPHTRWFDHHINIWWRIHIMPTKRYGNVEWGPGFVI